MEDEEDLVDRRPPPQAVRAASPLRACCHLLAVGMVLAILISALKWMAVRSGARSTGCVHIDKYTACTPLAVPYNATLEVNLLRCGWTRAELPPAMPSPPGRFVWNETTLQVRLAAEDAVATGYLWLNAHAISAVRVDSDISADVDVCCTAAMCLFSVG